MEFGASGRYVNLLPGMTENNNIKVSLKQIIVV